MPYNPDIHHRRSIRLRGYDYAQAGAYYITLCTLGRLHLFGKVQAGNVVLNDVGRMSETWLAEITNKFPTVVIDTHIVMPNHIHAIIVITDHKESNEPTSLNIEGAHVGAPLHNETNVSSSVGADLRVCPPRMPRTSKDAPTLPTIVQWFKTMTTNAYIRGVQQNGWQPFERKLWQRNYYERVIRDETELASVRRYISENSTR